MNENLSDDELYAMIGESLAAKEFGGAPPSVAELTRRGKHWIEGHRDAVCDLFCRSERVRLLCESHNFAKEGLVVLMDIAAHSTIGVPPFALSLLFVRLGYHRICATYDNNGRIAPQA